MARRRCQDPERDQRVCPSRPSLRTCQGGNGCGAERRGYRNCGAPSWPMAGSHRDSPALCEHWNERALTAVDPERNRIYLRVTGLSLFLLWTTVLFFFLIPYNSLFRTPRY